MNNPQIIVDTINIILIIAQVVTLAICVPIAIRTIRDMERRRNYNVVKQKKTWWEKFKEKIKGLF